ncbi:MAG: ribulose-bisphosphate carboxylase [Candidatus Gracilibacteria bacterium]|nr:ribulose-bisphosphate carboxylase [Candidatus Gracilibacteria bacterium]
MQKDYLGLHLKETELMKSNKYLLTVFRMVPEKGIDLEDMASEVAAESSTGSNMRVGTATKFSDHLNALVYKVDKKKSLAWLAYPIDIFDRGGNVQNILTYIAGNVFGIAELKELKLLDMWIPPAMLKRHDGPTYTIHDLKKYLGIKNRPILGTIVKPKIGLKPKEFAKVCYEFWMGGGDFVKFDEPQADQNFAPFKKTIDEIAVMLKRVEKETGKKKAMSVNISAADFDTMIKRADYVNKKIGKYHPALLVDGITAGWMAIQTAKRRYKKNFIHFHRAGHGAFTRHESPFGFSVPVLTMFGRLAGASGIHTGTAGIGKMAGDNEDVIAVHCALDKVSKGLFFTQDWGKFAPCCPIASGGLNPTKLHAVIKAFGTTDFITTMGAGCHSHPDGTRKGATALVQACEAYQKGKTIQEYAKTHEELAKAIEKFGKK